MYELMLDSANIQDLKECIANWPISGVTTNPTILKKEGKFDLYKRLKEINHLCAKERSLHIQVVSLTTEEIIEEAHSIVKKFTKDTYIKIPATVAGLPAIKRLAKEGLNITATAVYSSIQGIMSVLAGAKYVAVYYNRIEKSGTDPKIVISEIRAFIDGCKSDAKILAASFKRAEQISSAYSSGAQSVTASVEVIKEALEMQIIEDAVKAFAKDFEEIYGAGKTMKSV